METRMNGGDHGDQKRRSRIANLVFVGFLLIAGFYLISEHRAHLLGWLPFLIFLACPLLHLFMHGGHGGHGGRTGGTDDRPGPGHRR